MDASRFDDFARSLVTSRRGALRALLSGAVAGLGALATGRAAEERRSRFYRAGQPCQTANECGRAAPCQFGVCTPIACRVGINKSVPATTINLDNPCEFCAPTLEDWTGWTMLSNGSECGLGRSCCNGVCCSDTECCRLGVCEECGPHCTIGGIDINYGHFSFPGSCEWCDVHSALRAWTVVPNGMDCGDDLDQVCCNGNCCIENHCCGEDGNCTADCDACTIDGFPDPITNGDDHPTNDCRYCDTARDSTRWWPKRDRTPCNDPPGGLCCDGVCCQPGECCGVDLTCTATGCDRCWIDGVDYGPTDPKPGNDCQTCEPDRNPGAWTVKPNNLSCTSVPGGFCCNAECLPIEEFCDGVCLPPGECCNAEGNRVSGDCAPGCTIDGAPVNDGAVNPDDFCQVCNAAFPSVWSPRFHPDCPPACTIDGVIHFNGALNPANECEYCNGGTAWAKVASSVGRGGGEDVCCDGVCSGSCDSDGCTIDNVHYPDGTDNPGNPCEFCQASASDTAWTPKSPAARCGPSDQHWCCAGVCCDLGVCCNLSSLVCDPGACHNCVIGGEVFRHGDRNPANGCEQCNADASPNAWVHVGPNYYCDLDARDAVCCGGTCCNPGLGCNIDGFFCDDFSS